MLSQRSSLARQLAVLAAATAVVLSAGAFEPASLAAKPPPKPRPIAKPSKPALQPHPKLKQAIHELRQAWHHVHAAGRLPLPHKQAALASIGQALMALGGAPPTPNAAGKKGNQIKQAEEHLHRARKEVHAAKHLPPPLKVGVLQKIDHAQMVLKTHARPGAK